MVIRRRQKGLPLEQVIKNLEDKQARKEAAAAASIAKEVARSHNQPLQKLKFHVSQVKLDLIEGLPSISSVKLVVKQIGVPGSAVTKVMDIADSQAADVTIEVFEVPSGYTVHFDIVCDDDKSSDTSSPKSSKRRRTDSPQDSASGAAGDQIKLTTAPAEVFKPGSSQKSDGRYELLLWQDGGTSSAKSVQAQGSIAMALSRGADDQQTNEQVLDLTSSEPGASTQRGTHSSTRSEKKALFKRCPPVEYEFRNKAHFWRCKGRESKSPSINLAFEWSLLKGVWRVCVCARARVWRGGYPVVQICK